MRPDGGKTVRGVGLSGGEGADSAGSEITAEYSPCKVLVGRGVRWATIVAAAGADAERLPLRGRQIPERKRGWRWVTKQTNQDGFSTVATEAGTRATNLPQMSRKVLHPHTWPVCAKIAKL